MLKMAIYQYTLLTTVTMKILYPTTVMSKPWRKSKNHTKIYAIPTFSQNQLVSTPYSNNLFKVTSCPINVSYINLFLIWVLWSRHLKSYLSNMGENLYYFAFLVQQNLLIGNISLIHQTARKAACITHDRTNHIL